MIGTAKIHPLESTTDIQRARHIKKISTGLGITVFIVSLAFPAYILKEIVTKEPSYIVVKKHVTENGAETIGAAQPSYSQYHHLYSTSPHMVHCTCSQVSINYRSFVQLQAQFHPICSSAFISQQWIDALLHTDQTLCTKDFRKTASYSFQALRALCQLSKQTFEHNLMQFLSDEYISTSLLSFQSFESLMMARINQFKSSTIKSFLLSFSMIRDMMKTNALFSSLQTNYKLYGQGNNISIFPTEYNGGCNCAVSTSCVTQSSIYNYSSGTTLFSIPGFYTGCYVIDSLLRSDLRCFYDLTCINQLTNYVPSLSNLPAYVFDSLSSNVYQPNITIENILNNLMVEQFFTSLSYRDYYVQCSPSYCTYPTSIMETVERVELIENKTDVASTIGLVIGIMGSIIAILHLIIPRLVKLIIGGN